MQVFMPYPDLKESVCCLDPKRLGNGIYREAKTLISGGWPNHPAAKIWAEHRGALACYALEGLAELRRRGRAYPQWEDYFNKILWDEVIKEGPDKVFAALPFDFSLPPLIGYAPFHSGHRAALLAKDPEWYGQFGWDEIPEPDTKKAYIWRLP